MTYKSLLVHLDLNGDNEGVLNVAAELAARFEARVIGIAACQPVSVLYSDGFFTPGTLSQDRDDIARELAAVEAQFRQAMSGQVGDVSWRTSICFTPLADFIAEEARSADLIVTGKDIGPSLLDETHRVNIGDLVMRAGRPVLLVPPGVRQLTMSNVVMGWKESREARRAAADAIPLLRQAEEVTVLNLAKGDAVSVAAAPLEDVCQWLALHGIKAKAEVLPLKGSEPGALRARLLEGRCDFLVAGAYGHSRVGEWAFGGVTQDVLLDPDCCVLLSH